MNYKNKIKIGLVGCGRISKKHLDAIKFHSKLISLHAVCDIDKTVLSNNRFNGVTKYLSIEDMLSHESDLDLVVLCTPSGLHPSQAILCSKYGLNTMTEKPMATRWKDGLKMISAFDSAKRHLFVVKQNRFNPTLKILKQAIDENRFGKINLVQVNVFWTRGQEYYDQADWRGTWEFDGGALMNQASHYIDLLDWLIGPVEKIQSMVSTSRNIEVEDTGVMNVKWRCGALGSVSVTMLTFPENLEGSITILGENGSVKLGGVAVNEIQHWNFKDSRDYDKNIFDKSYSIDSVYGNGHIDFYSNVIDVLQGKEKPLINGREGLKSLEILIAAYLAARDGKTLSLPLDF